MHRKWQRPTPVLIALVLLPGCGSDGPSALPPAERAQRAYLGIDASIDRAITLGFQGFNTASTANISPQTTSGARSGTLTVTGQVDQGASANKGMRLFTAYTSFSDNGEITYTTDAAALPSLRMQLTSIPTGTLTGTLVGIVSMVGEETGSLTLDLSFTGNLRSGTTMGVERVPGSTRITGTATSPAGTHSVDVIR